MDDDIRDLVRASLQSLLATPVGDVAAALDELGWADLLGGDPVDAHAVLFTETGKALVPTAALDGVAAHALGLPPDTRVVWPHAGGANEPRVESAELVSGLALAELRGPVVTPSGTGVAFVDPASITTTPASGFAADQGWLSVRGRLRAGPPTGDWAAAVGACRLALAAELNAVTRTALDLACEHVGTRHQFGRPLGSFQSVRHRLAGAYAELAGAEAVASAAHHDPALASAAKAAAGRAHGVVAREAIQVCGGMGLSDEHRLPRCVRRGFLLDALLGTSAELMRDDGIALLAGTEPVSAGAF